MAEDNCDVMWLSCDHRNNNSVIHMEVWAGFFLHWSCFWHLQGWEGPSACRWRHWQHSSFPSCWFSSIVHAVWKWRQSESGKSILSFQELSLLLQVVDGFFVKRVQDVRESAAYLTVMTRYLTKLYQVCLLFPGSEVRVMETAVCLMCFKRNLFFFLPNLNCRTACWPVAPGSWRAMERVRCRAPGPPPALSSHLQNSTTALSRTRSAYTVATISGENTAKPSKDCCVPAVFMDTIINVSHFCSSVRQWRRCLPDSWCRSAVYPGTRLLLYWSATAPHTGDRLLLFAWWKLPAFTLTLTTNFIVSFWPTRS